MATTSCDSCSIELDEETDRFVEMLRETSNGLERTGMLCEPCNEIRLFQDYEKTGVLTSKLTLLAALNSSARRQADSVLDRILLASENIRGYIKVFERDVWFMGLQEIVRAARVRGMSFSTETHKVLTYTMAGRAMITISNEAQNSVTLITEEDAISPRMGMGIEATEAEATQLISAAIEAWKSGLRPESDKEVHIAGF